jgi:hypothetical protein
MKELKNFINACNNKIITATPKEILAFYDDNVSIEMLGHKIILPFNAVVFNAVIACCDKIYEDNRVKGNTNKNLSK